MSPTGCEQQISTLRHKGKVAVITGAASGIGRAFAVRLASEGAHVVIADRNNAEETRTEITSAGGSALAIACDISLEHEVEELGRRVDAEGGGCDILVNNAGLFPSCQFSELEFSEWRRIMATNLDAIFLTCKRFVPGMRAKRWGRIVNMTSNTYGQVTKGLAHYIASKAGVIGFTRALASEVGADGITVNAIGPGARARQHLPRRGVGGALRRAGAASGHPTGAGDRGSGRHIVVPGERGRRLRYGADDLRRWRARARSVAPAGRRCPAAMTSPALVAAARKRLSSVIAGSSQSNCLGPFHRRMHCDDPCASCRQ
jgi:NAD(P)-dependent dehydrogenase (short-subunit alcohol dehydrogenase family)